QRDLYFVVVVQSVRTFNLLPVQPGAVAAVQIFDIVNIVLAENAQVMARYLALCEDHVAVVTTPQDDTVLSDRDLLLFVLVGVLNNQNGAFASGLGHTPTPVASVYQFRL